MESPNCGRVCVYLSINIHQKPQNIVHRGVNTVDVRLTHCPGIQGTCVYEGCTIGAPAVEEIYSLANSICGVEADELYIRVSYVYAQIKKRSTVRG